MKRVVQRLRLLTKKIWKIILLYKIWSFFPCFIDISYVLLIIKRCVLMKWSRYRDISIYGKGFAKEWNSHTIFEIKWDANRDPDQKFSVTFKTNTSDIVDGEQFLGLMVIEYPGRTVNVDLELSYMGMNITVTIIKNAQFTDSVLWLL